MNLQQDAEEDSRYDFKIFRPYSAYTTSDEIPSRDPLWGQKITCKKFLESELLLSHNLAFLVLKKAKIMTSHEGLILRPYMAENTKNVSTSQSKISIFMIFPENIANYHREAVLKFQDN